MSFMQPQIYAGQFFRIETTAGTEIVPADDIGRTCGTDVSAFLNYLEGTPLDDDAIIDIEDGWLARISAPGYLDCTNWSAHKSEAQARAYLDEMYGEE